MKESLDMAGANHDAASGEHRGATLSAAAGSQDDLRAPPAVRYAVIALIGLLIVGALYLGAVRGDALLADLSAIAALICG